MVRTGVVLGVHASRSLVRDDGDGREVSCLYRGKLARGLRRATNVLVVGDRVEYEGDGPEGVIVLIRPRRNELSRRSAGSRSVQHVLAANVDRAIIVVAAELPRYRTGFVDRCMAAARHSDIEPVLVVNKMDLAEEERAGEVERDAAVYRDAGMRTIPASATRGTGIDAVRSVLRDVSSVFIGPSGVGKSSLVNAIQPGLSLETAEVSEATQKGRHTTTRSRLLPLDGGGFVVDTPGVRAFGLVELGPIELALAYPEFERPAARCRFKPCTHTHEPGCAVRAAVQDGDIVPWRYANYCRLVESIDDDAD